MVSMIAPMITDQLVPDRKYIRVAEAAIYTGLSESEIYRSIYCGQLRALRYKSRSWLLTREDLDTWIDSCSTPNVA